MTGRWSELQANGYVLWQLVRQQLILRYRRTVIGYFWTLVNPLLMMSVTAVVFSALFKVPLREYAVFLFSGMIAWNSFSSTVSQSCQALIQNEGLIKKIYLPKLLFPLSVSMGAAIDSVLSFIALFVIIMVLGGEFSWALVILPLSFLLLFAFSLGVGLVMSVMTVFFRDLVYIINIILQAMFFLTPIMYEKTMLTGPAAFLMKVNPLVPFVDIFRSPLAHATLPDGSSLLLAALSACLSLGIGLLVFILNEKKIVYRL
ncbi:ABC transporter permease [Pseudomonas arcuscaelestis]|nr:ABC transporter permease [Pseudomonas arcuscaelestis]